MSIRIGHLGDLHLGERKFNRLTAQGVNEREVDFERAALLAADKLIELNVDVCVVAGDLLHDTHISSSGLNGAIKFCRKFQDAGVPLIVVGGNHDEAESPNRVNMLHILEHHGVRLFLHQEHLDINGVRLHLIPFRVLSRATHGHGEIRPLEISDELPNVLVSHGYAVGVDGKFPPEEVEIPQQWLEDPRLDLICLGHIHRQKKLDGYKSVFYSGATERRDFGEENENPGFIVHDVSRGDCRTSMYRIADFGVPQTPRKMVSFNINARNLTIDELDHVVREMIEPDLEGAIVRFNISEVSSEYDRSRLRNAWNKAFKEVGGFNLDIVTNSKRVTEMLDVEFTAPPVNLSEAFHEFLAGQTIEDQKLRANISALGAEVLSSAHEKLLAQETD